jgi:hypothetical protein
LLEEEAAHLAATLGVELALNVTAV